MTNLQLHQDGKKAYLETLKKEVFSKAITVLKSPSSSTKEKVKNLKALNKAFQEKKRAADYNLF